MNSMILSGYKKKLGFFRGLISYIYSSEPVYILTLFSLTSLFLSSGFFSEFKFALIFLIIVWIVAAIRIKNAFISLLLITLYTLPFSNPSKIYTVLVIPAYKLLGLPGGVKSDYNLGYGLTLVNVFLFLTLIALL